VVNSGVISVEKLQKLLEAIILRGEGGFTTEYSNNRSKTNVARYDPSTAMIRMFLKNRKLRRKKRRSLLIIGAAVHELAHHVLFVRRKPPVHSPLFFFTLGELVERLRRRGITLQSGDVL